MADEKQKAEKKRAAASSVPAKKPATATKPAEKRKQPPAKAASKRQNPAKSAATASRKGVGGRPSKYDTLDMAKVAMLAKRGWTDAEMAEFFGVAEATWYNWKDAHPEFLEALKDWKEEADARVERSLYERATGYSHPEDKIFQHNGEPVVVPTVKHYPPDTTAAIFWLKNRKREQWRDRHDIDHGVQNDSPLATLLDQVSGKTLKPSE